MLMVSASRRWLILTMIPILIQVPITWFTPTFIMVANSETVTNSVSLSTLLCAASAAISSFIRSATASRFSRRYLAPFLFWFFDVRRARVSFTWRATASSSTSSDFWMGRFFLFFLPPPCWLPLSWKFWLPPLFLFFLFLLLPLS